MNKLFNNILIPVDFSEVSELAIEKAVGIANHFRCEIHLVYVEKEASLLKRAGLRFKNGHGETNDKAARLSELQNRFLSHLQPGLALKAVVLQGNKNLALMEYGCRHQVDLLIVGKPAGFAGSFLARQYNINEITKKIGCPLLTVRKENYRRRLANIVLPVCSVVPIRKIMFASYLARKYNSKIHLLAIAGNNIEQDGNRNQYLHKAYQLLRDNTNLAIECHTMRGHNIAETTLRFAQKIDADLIVVNQGKESLLSGFLVRFLDGFLFNSSRIPVMTI